MLTQDKLEKLQLLINHARYGKLLEKAIEIWKTSRPVRNTYGTYFVEKLNAWINDIDYGKCLIGAAITSCKNDINQFNENKFDYQVIKASEEFCLDGEELVNIISGFDGRSIDDEFYIDAYNFGKNVAAIVFGI